MTTYRPRRSGLYMPASNARALEKAKTLAADAVIFDLEDAVAPEAKAQARAQACAAVQGGGYGRRELVIRVNAMASDWGDADIAAAAAARPDAILIPKVQAAGDLSTVRAGLDAAGAPPDLALWAMMETPLAVLNAHDIAAAAPANRYPLTVFVMGTNDLVKETRAELTEDRQPVLAWMSACIVAARAYGLDILDGVYNNFRDEAGLRRECEQGRALGMDGKTLIHPNQIGPCNGIFSPAEEEIDWS
ncbi:MAG: CoA ester lyase, partial [Hyphomicrobiales bacterium]|nr:CoA ester lyase [Hyphomicrobiales bacterium]